ncbi:unnamed protein product [Leuciscus chuanchicus]
MDRRSPGKTRLLLEEVLVRAAGGAHPVVCVGPNAPVSVTVKEHCPSDETLNRGNRVYWDCTGDTSTTCVPCPASTYTDEPNRLIICYSCSVCDASHGLYIKSKCTTIRDTICDVLDGYHCIEDSNSQCHHAIKHSVCEPGQETKTLGTKISDTVCVDCTPGFYSPSGLNCTKWTNCTARNEIQTENGSSSTVHLQITTVRLLWERDCIGVFSPCAVTLMWWSSLSTSRNLSQWNLLP